MTSNYFHLCRAMILVYDPDLSETATVTALREWIENCYRYNPVASLVLSLWANQTKDEPTENVELVQSAELRGLIETYNIPPSLQFRVSGLTGKGIMDAFKSVVDAVVMCDPQTHDTTDVDHSVKVFADRTVRSQPRKCGCKK